MITIVLQNVSFPNWKKRLRSVESSCQRKQFLPGRKSRVLRYSTIFKGCKGFSCVRFTSLGDVRFSNEKSRLHALTHSCGLHRSVPGLNLGIPLYNTSFVYSIGFSCVRKMFLSNVRFANEISRLQTVAGRCGLYHFVPG